MPFEERPIDIATGSSVLLVLPPFLGIDRPYLGLHTLQACARRAGFEVGIVYANASFAAEIGVELYNEICYAGPEHLLGEQLFALEAFGPVPGGDGLQGQLNASDQPEILQKHGISLNELRRHAASWTRRFVQALVAAQPRIIGCNSTFEQTAASFAILAHLRQAAPDIVTLLGGANCDGPMGAGLASLFDYPDYIFSGESEESFLSFLRDIFSGNRPKERVISSLSDIKMDVIPPLDYSDYYRAIDEHIDGGLPVIANETWMPYQSSRGCWWGQKHHCTFCGLNDVGMTFREKKADAVIAELDGMLEHHPNKKVFMVDSIMPTTYFKDFLPMLIEKGADLQIFYEQKANLSLERVEMLVKAGVTVIQPGIEALSTSLLRRMDKGISGPQNVALLRYARATGLGLYWNLLYAFPGDHEQDYEETLALLPKIVHLHPPTGVWPLMVDRFSPYFERAEKYGITNVKPMPAYSSVFPPRADLMNIAYHFVGDYDSAHRRSPHLADAISAEAKRWREMWAGDDAPPVLAIEFIKDDTFLLVDSRNRSNSGTRISFITLAQAQAGLCSQPASSVDNGLLTWAVEESEIAVNVDGTLMPLATARPELIRQFQARSRPTPSTRLAA
jgi:ribosomal peptide maturation radical SAM protein 1